jgi:hypothetical protein
MLRPLGALLFSPNAQRESNKTWNEGHIQALAYVARAMPDPSLVGALVHRPRWRITPSAGAASRARGLETCTVTKTKPRPCGRALFLL